MKLLFIVICIILSFSSVVFSQNKATVDSLKKVLKAVNCDTIQINTLNILCFELSASSPEQALIYGQEALELSEKISNKKGKAKSYNNIGIAYLNQGHFSEAESFYLKAIAVYKTIGQSKSLADCYNNLGWVNNLMGMYNEALSAFNTALDFFKKTNDKKGIATCYNNSGAVYANLGDFGKSEKYYSKAITILEAIHDKKGLADSYGNYGFIYDMQGKYPQAIECYQKSLDLCFELKILTGCAKGYINIGVIHTLIGDYQKALKLYQKSLKISEELKDKKGIADCYNNIGYVYSELKDSTKALHYNQMSLNIRKEIGDKAGVAGCYMNIGNIYYEENNYNEALSCYNNAIKIFKEIGSKNNVAQCLYDIGMIHADLNKFREAEENLTKALNIIIETGDKNSLSNIYGHFALLNQKQKKYKDAINYAQKSYSLAKEMNSQDIMKQAQFYLYESKKLTGDFKQALEHYELFKQLNDSVFNTEKQNNISKLEAIYQTEKKQKEIEIQQAQLLQKETELKRQKLQKYIIAGTLGATLLFAFILFFVFRYRQKLRAVKAELSGQEHERSRMARELHDGIGSTLTGIRLQLEKIKTENNLFNIETVINNLSQTSIEVRTISHNLSLPRFENTGFDDIITDFIRKISSHSETEISFMVYPEINWKKIQVSLQSELYRIIQETVSNALKHANASKISIQITKHPAYFNLLIEDNGTGMPDTNASQGIGLQNIHARTAALKGEIKVDSIALQGTSININIPI